MSLFTSNSKNYQSSFKSNGIYILRPIIVAIVVLAVYQILIWCNFLTPHEGIAQQESNLIRAERYFYGDEAKTKFVVVGSSMIANIPVNDIGSNLFNLGIRGDSSVTGLELVKLRKTKPSLVLVELNGTISRKMNADLIKSFSYPVSYLSRLYFSMFRAEYRPISIFVTKLKKIKGDDNETVNVQQKTIQSELEKNIVKRAVQTNSKLLNQEEIDSLIKGANFIQNQISEIRKGSIKVVLFDVPREQEVIESPREKQIQQLIRNLFPKNNYEWLPDSLKTDWVTGDGVHLKSSDAVKYAEFLQETLQKKGYLSN
ncbi:hypothetical protein I8748_29430 [Nostoc sp. CENA67]|uniref:Uncharacterized protein n=1 Tax=Amazonocrinis nigriterrae CENA67 TaxID=2794033 RepID=A0A8J7HUM2_9NOST|nr:hypothetical protein [Amazonocrinis nigriterrae]MBH8566233.1 hypothetical protein [Amazonocrinis nigriterrae CENA67]